MGFQVTLAPSGHSFQVGEGQAILNASHEAGFAVPYSCKAGACRTCRGRVVEGQVDFGHVHAAYLSEAEREQGWALLCQATPLTDVIVEVNELAGLAAIRRRITPGRVMEIRRVTANAAVLRIKLPMNENLVFLAGQYVEFILADGQRRAYSIASAPAVEGVVEIELHVRHTPGGLFTDHVFSHLQVRDLVRMEAPLGTFFLREDSAKPVVFVASGTGFAPVKSMLQHAQRALPGRPLALYWGGWRRADLYDLEWVKTYAASNPNFLCVPVLTEPTPECAWSGRTGLVHQAVMEDLPDLSGHQVYACGAPVMVDAARRDFSERCGLPPTEFFADSFLDAADKARARTSTTAGSASS